MITHTSIFQPILEALLAFCRLPHSRTALGHNPLHQTLLKLGVILLIDLVLHLATQSVGWTFVGHAWGSLLRKNACKWKL